MMAEEELTYREKIEKVFKETESARYRLTYDSAGETLEPAYYWILDFLRDMLKFDVRKTDDFISAAAGSGWFTDLGTKKTAMEKRASELMISIGAVTKTIIQILWELKEFELRFANYDKYNKPENKGEKKEGEWALKGIWLTDVDSKKGNGSINVLTTQLNMSMLRDAFMGMDPDIPIEKFLAEKGLQVSDRVKRILIERMSQFKDWIKLSEKELRKRYKIEIATLKSNVNALKMYAKWAKPYLLATKNLMPPTDEEDNLTADIVTGFDVARMYITLLATKGKYQEKDPKDNDKFVKVVRIKIHYRSIPTMATQQRGYVQRGRFDIYFTGHAMTPGQLKDIRNWEDDEVLTLIEGLTEDTLKALKEDLAVYGIKWDEEPKEKKDDKGKKSPLEDISQAYKKRAKEVKDSAQKRKKEIFGLFKWKKVSKESTRKEKWELIPIRKKVSKDAAKKAFQVYNIYKIAHGMATPPP